MKLKIKEFNLDHRIVYTTLWTNCYLMYAYCVYSKFMLFNELDYWSWIMNFQMIAIRHWLH